MFNHPFLQWMWSFFFFFLTDLWYQEKRRSERAEQMKIRAERERERQNKAAVRRNNCESDELLSEAAQTFHCRCWPKNINDERTADEWLKQPWCVPIRRRKQEKKTKRQRRKQMKMPGRRWFCPTWVSLDTRWSFSFKKKKIIDWYETLNIPRAYHHMCRLSDQQTQTGPKRQTEREKKKKILSDRRKELNTDYMKDDKLR